jgi:hypothetical protein
MKNKAIRFTVTSLLLFVFAASNGQDETKPLPQFLFQKFARGAVKMKAGNSYSATLNYNMADEEMVFEQKGNYMVLDKPAEIDTVFLLNKKFVPVEKAFYEVVSGGSVPVYIQHKVRYSPVASTSAYGVKSQTQANTHVRTAQAGNQVRSLDVPEDVTIAYASVNWVKKNGTLEKFSNANQLAKLFPEREAEIKGFIKENKIDFKEPADIFKLAEFLNR